MVGPTTRLRRALLYMPGDSRRKIEKGAASAADCIVMDWEDGIAPGAREEARAQTITSARALDFGDSECLIRVNPVDHTEHEADISALQEANVDGVVLPKVEGAAQLAKVCETLLLQELRKELPRHSLSLLVIVETARGLAHLPEIAAFAGSEPRCQALIFGALDYIASVGGQTTRSGQESHFARSAVVMQAKAHGLQAIDTVYPAYQDEAGLRADTRRGLELGYTGKQIIHPNQIEPVQSLHSPTEQQIAAARRIIQAYKAQTGKGVGAFALDGRMVDLPIVKEARRLLERAAATTEV